MPRELTMEEEMMKDYYIKKASGYNLPEEAKETKLKAALQTLKEALKEDTSPGSYYYGWQANISMAFFDTFRDIANQYDGEYSISTETLSMICNNAAKNFLNQFIK